MLHEDDLRIFPEDLYAQGHVLHSPEAVVYSPKELMEMDWLGECVEGSLPRYRSAGCQNAGPAGDQRPE